jgi:hypothetical protein
LVDFCESIFFSQNRMVICNESGGYLNAPLQLLGRSSHLKICKLWEDNAYSRHSPPFIFLFCSIFHWMFEFQYWFCNTNSGEHVSNRILLSVILLQILPCHTMELSTARNMMRMDHSYSPNVRRCNPENVFRVVLPVVHVVIHKLPEITIERFKR